MKKTSKKIMSLILAVLMLMSVMAVFASAECEHVWGDEKEIIIAATCREEGEARVTCTKCGFKKIVTTPKADHAEKYLKTVPEVKATCETRGNNEYKVCTFCGSDVGKEVIMPLGHDKYIILDMAVPTCTEAAQGHIKCSREGCTYNELYEVPALGHEKGGDGNCIRCGVDMASCTCMCHNDNIISRIMLLINDLMNKLFPTYLKDKHGKLIYDENGDKIQLYYHCCDCTIPEGKVGV